MTTIAFHHKDGQIAVDSRTISGNLINTDASNKIHKLNDLLIILSGMTCDFDIFVSEYPDIKTDVDCSGFLVEDKKTYHICVKNGNLKKSQINYNDAEGSGYAFAISAMDHGKSAKESVEYAMTRDNCTGGKIQVIDVKTGKVIS